MKFTLKMAVFAVALLLPFTSHAQLFEDFEDGSKASYATGTVNLPSGSWVLNDALIGNANNDKKNGSQSVRIREGFVAMNFDKSSGVGDITFLAANAGFANDDGGVLKLEISYNGGSDWDEIDDNIAVTDDLEEYAFPVNQPGDIRIRISKVDGGRINVDDVLITDFEELSEDPSLRVSFNNERLENNDAVNFGTISQTASRTRSISIRNQGEVDLEINDISLTGRSFTLENTISDPIESTNSVALNIVFEDTEAGTYSETITLTTNDPDNETFVLTLEGEVFDTSEPITIAEARQLEFGTVVTISGWVTVGDQFSGPAFVQDETAALAVFYADLHDNVNIGDSVRVTGPLTEFNPINGTPGDFLMQIAANSEDDVEFEIFEDGKRQIVPTNITIQAMNSGEYEAQLVQIDNVTIEHSGAFQGNTNYTITDATGSAFIRIDANSNAVGAVAPEGTVNLIGVIDQFNGDYQIKPRFTDDLGVDEVEFPFEDVPKDQTFDVVTWNIEWFGSSGNGPDDVELQLENVKTVITTIDADLYAFQEIANPEMFDRLITDLVDYRGFLADFSQSQKTAYLFKHAVIDSIDSGLISEGQNSQDWAGRLPLLFEFDANIGEHTQRITSVNIHAKAFADQDSYNQRVNASGQIKNHFDGRYVQSNLIFIGDYNDDVTESTFQGQVSPYQNFVDDQNYHVLTKSLSERGFTSYRSLSMIDHITVTTSMNEFYMEGTERIENVNYIGSYLSTTSDHFPVWTRFSFGEPTSTNDEWDLLPNQVDLQQNYPNPFNPTTNISFALPENSNISLKVYDITGREVATLINNQTYSSGSHSVNFDASALSSGMYIYQLQLSNGQALTRKMMLVK